MEAARLSRTAAGAACELRTSSDGSLRTLLTLRSSRGSQEQICRGFAPAARGPG